MLPLRPPPEILVLLTCADVVSFKQLIKGTNSTSPCTRSRVFLLGFLGTNPCPTLYPTLCFWKQLRGWGIVRSQALLLSSCSVERGSRAKSSADGECSLLRLAPQCLYLPSYWQQISNIAAGFNLLALQPVLQKSILLWRWCLVFQEIIVDRKAIWYWFYCQWKMSTIYFKWPLFQLVEFTILYGVLASMFEAPIYQKQRYCYLYLYTTTSGLLLAVV